MTIYTDNIQFAQKYVNAEPEWQKTNYSDIPAEIRYLSNRLFLHEEIYHAESDNDDFWQYIFLVQTASESHFDIFIELVRENHHLPDKILCLAGSGKKFHGFKNRTWISVPGNIHLSVYLSPGKHIRHFAAGFMILAAVSVLQTIDHIASLKKKSMIKWINDILIEDAKVCGVLAHTLTQNKIVTGAVLGIGLNVEVTPIVDSTPFVPKIASLQDYIPPSKKIDGKIVFNRLISVLKTNYLRLISDRYQELLEFYKLRSLVIGKEVKIFSDNSVKKTEKIDSGRVVSIGENLELFFENRTSPITNGRLIIID